MANINLISERRAERVRLTRAARGLVAAIIAAGAIGLGATAFTGAQFLLARSRVIALEAQLGLLRPVLAEIEAFERDRGSLQPKIETLTQAQTTTRRWFGILEGLKRAVPEQTWLTSIAVERSGEVDKQLKINGITINQSRVGETMFRLTQQPELYKKTDLRYTQTTKIDDQQFVEFELSALLNQPELEEKLGAANATETN